MKFYCRVVPYLILVVLLAACGAASAATRVQDGDAGTIGACLAQPDGTRATLIGEEVLWSGRSGKSFAIKEWFEARADTPRLVVVSTGQLPVEEFWSVDVTGTLRRVAGGGGGTQRVLVVSPADVRVYCSSNGRPCPFIPVKASGTEWPDKSSLIELAGSTASARTVVSLADAGLPPMPDSPDSEPSPPAPGSRDSLKWLPDGAPVSVNGAVISAAFPDQQFFYVEKSDRSFGIWVSSAEWVNAGNLVDITGRMATGGDERAVVAEAVTVLDYNNYPLPTEIGMPNKMLGGGAVGQFTPGIANAAGLNNTGLLARAWGEVTDAAWGYPSIFYIDDGSNVTADLRDPAQPELGRHTGVKVYDLTWDALPDVGSYQSVSGVSAAEVPGSGESSIRVLWKVAPVTRATGPGSGTIHGTVTATGANGKAVRVYCASASTTATFSGNTASYTLYVPYGDHAVTVSLLGYKTTTQLGTVNSGTPVTLDFTMPAIERRVDVVPSPWRIPPDGTSQTTVTAIVRDEEGRRFGNEPVTWSVDVGTVISSDATTDAVGEARLVLQAPSHADTGGVLITCGGVQGVGSVEYASPTAPSVRILTPTQGESVSGLVTVEVSANDYAGTEPGIVHIGVAVDGQPLMPLMESKKDGTWRTYRIPNGVHQIKAAATDLDEEAGFSQVVTVNVNNPAYSVAETSTVINSTNPTTTISATLATSSTWEVAIKSPSSGTVIKTFSGSGTAVSAIWDGKKSDGTDAPAGVYSYDISANAQSCADGIVCIWRSTGRACALTVEGWDFPHNAAQLDEVAKQCLKRGFDVLCLPRQIATWDNFRAAFENYPVEVLFVKSHGAYEIRNNDCQPALIPQISQFLLQDAVVCSYRPEKTGGGYFTEYPAPGDKAYADLGTNYGDPPWNNWPTLYAHYVTEIPANRRWNMLLVWMNTCFCGRIGAEYVQESSWDSSTPLWTSFNDMASVFYIHENAEYYGSCYVGYYEKAADDDRYTRMTDVVFGSLGWGYTMFQAVTRDAYQYNNGLLTRKYYGWPLGPGYIEVDGPCFCWRTLMPSYHNLRVFGNPMGFRLTPI